MVMVTHTHTVQHADYTIPLPYITSPCVHCTAYATALSRCIRSVCLTDKLNKKHLKNVGPIRDCEPPHAHSPGVATGTVARRLRIDVHDANDDDNA